MFNGTSERGYFLTKSSCILQKIRIASMKRVKLFYSLRSEILEQFPSEIWFEKDKQLLELRKYRDNKIRVVFICFSRKVSHPKVKILCYYDLQESKLVLFT
jgi:hypothetical protein